MTYKELLQLRKREIACKVTPEEFLEELKLLMKDFYIGRFADIENGVQISLLNGQKFIVQVKEGE